MKYDVSSLRPELERAGGKIWLLNAESRRRVLQHLAISGPAGLADLLPERLALSVFHEDSADVVQWYVRWIGAHLESDERPAFDLSDDALCKEGPRVLLVSPVYRLKEASIGLVRIAFFLRGLGIRADWVAATPDNLEEILRQARKGSYHVIGHGTTHYTFGEDMRFLARMADASPQSCFLLGGHGAVFDPPMLRQVLSETPVSVVVRGFGERSTACVAMAQVPAGFGCPLPLRRIPGIHLLHDDEVLSTGVDAYNELEFRVLHAIFDGRYYPVEEGVTRLITSTHCPFPCVFCSSRNFPEQAATRLDPSDVVHLVSEVRRHHPELHFVEFNDDNFSIGYRRDGRFHRGTDWLSELCDLSKGEVFDGLRTYCNSRADTIDYETLVHLVKDTKLAKI